MFASGVDPGLRSAVRDESVARSMGSSGDHAEYLDGGFGWVIVACKPISALLLMRREESANTSSDG